MATITFTGDDSNTTYVCVAFSSRINWLEEQDIIGLDTETTVTDSILDRRLKVVAIADDKGDQIWVIEWDYLTQSEQDELLRHIEKKLCIIQNVAFDYQVLLKYNCRLTRVYDTMLAEQVLTTGLASESGYHGLQAIYQRRFGLMISKDEQLTFGKGPYNDNQIDYAGIDVLKLGVLRRLQLKEMEAQDKRMNLPNHKGMKKTIWWENEFVLAIADMEYNGVRIDKDKWYAIEDAVKPIYDSEIEQLNEIAKEDFYDILLDNGWIVKEDTFTEQSVWSSSVKKQLVLNKIYDTPVEKTSKVALKQYLKDNDPSFPEGLKLSGKSWDSDPYPYDLNDKYSIIKLLILNSKENDMTEHLNAFLLTNMKEFAVEQGWVKQAGKVYINWASPSQRLQIFKAIDFMIESTSKDVLADYVDKHRIIPHYLIWGETDYQIKNFGKKFYDDHVDLDGKHRTRYNQILSTGRLSSVRPNLLNIPRKNDVYREAFIPDTGRSFINYDFDGQELVVTAYISKEPLWLEALEKGYDIHSRNAELIYGQKWLDGTEKGCAYYTDSKYKKCKCEKHMELRDNSKTITFGMLYGASEFSLAPRLDITVQEAADLLNKFFDSLPYIRDMMKRLGNFGINNGYIIEPVFGRVRKFDQYKIANEEHHEAVRRRCMNFPIQAAGSALLKIAIVLFRRELLQRELPSEKILLMPYHDEISVQDVTSFAEQTAELLHHSMLKAGKVAGFPMLKAAGGIGSSWLEAH